MAGTGGPAALVGRVRSAVAAAPARQAVAHRRGAAALAGSGRFDREYYQAQAGRTFPDTVAAARHYVATGRYADLSPHPLYDPTYHLGSAERRHAAKRSPFESFLAAGDSVARRASHLFDADRWAEANPGARGHPGGAWAHFLDTAGTEAPLPLHGTPASRPTATLGALRAELLVAARHFREQDDISSPDRLLDTIDPAATAAVLAEVEAAERPATVAGTPLVSVVMPVRNRPGQVLEAIASVVAQTTPDWELLVVDDGSTDSTAAGVAEVAAHDPRVRLIRLPPSGVCAARNAAADAARGTYIAWLDSDTTWLPDHLRALAGVMSARGLRAAHDIQQFTDADGRVRYRAFETDIRHLEVGNTVDLNVLMVTRELLTEVGGFDATLRRAVDYDLVLKLAAVTEIPLVPVVGSVYRDDVTDPNRIGVRELKTWNYVVRERRFVDWDRLAREAGDRPHDRTSVLVSGRNVGLPAWVTVGSVLEATGADADVEVRVVDLASTLTESLRTAAVRLLDPERVTVQRSVVNLNRGVGLNVALAASSGATVVLLAPGATVSPGWLAGLRSALHGGAESDTDGGAGRHQAGGGSLEPAAGAFPVLLSRGRAVLSAGTVFAPTGSLPVPLLAGLAPGDVARLAAARGGDVVTPAAPGAALAVRAADLIDVRGFDPLFVEGPDDTDLALRLATRTGRPFRLAPDVEVVLPALEVQGAGEVAEQNRRLFLARWQPLLAAGTVPGTAASGSAWAQAGFDLLGFEAVEQARAQVRVVPVLRHRPGADGLRWVVDTTSFDGDRARPARWRDDADELAAALRDAGQQAWVRAPGDAAAPRGTVDVVVAAAGHRGVHPVPGVPTVLWLPADAKRFGRQSAFGFDLVLAEDSAEAAVLIEAVEADLQRYVPAPAAVPGTPGPVPPPVLASPVGGDTTVLGEPADARPLVAAVAELIRSRTLTPAATDPAG